MDHGVLRGGFLAMNARWMNVGARPTSGTGPRREPTQNAGQKRANAPTTWRGQVKRWFYRLLGLTPCAFSTVSSRKFSAAGNLYDSGEAGEFSPIRRAMAAAAV